MLRLGLDQKTADAVSRAPAVGSKRQTEIALAVSQPEEAFLENGIPPVPQGQSEVEPLLIIRNAGKAILSPAIGARSSLTAWFALLIAGKS
jgi:hypothetical protein